MSDLRPGDRTLLRLLCPIEDALNHPEVTDIVINKVHEVGIRKGGGWEWRYAPGFDFDTLDAATILIGQRSGREFDEANPYVNSTLPGGQRFQGVRPPGTNSGHLLWAIRRPPDKARKLDDPDFDDLTSEVNGNLVRRQSVATEVASAFRNRDWRALFRGARRTGMSIGFVGSMGEGKSDMIRRVIGEGRPDARMVTIQTDDEIGEVGPHNKASLIYDDAKLDADDALKIAKRLVPAEIVMGEVRLKEAWSLIMMMNSGCSGLSTWHADEGREHEGLCDMARAHPSAEKMKDELLMQKARAAFDVIVFCRRTDKRNSETDAGFRISSVRLMAAENEEGESNAVDFDISSRNALCSGRL